MLQRIYSNEMRNDVSSPSFLVPRSSGVPIDAALEARIPVDFVGHDRKVDIRAVRAATVVLAHGEDLVLRTPVLPDEPPQITEPLSARERPERLLAEEQIEAPIGRARIRQRRQRRRRQRQRPDRW